MEKLNNQNIILNEIYFNVDVAIASLNDIEEIIEELEESLSWAV